MTVPCREDCPARWELVTRGNRLHWSGNRRKARMARCVLLVLALLSVADLSMPASADPYPWCAVYGARGGSQNCYMQTLQQCREQISGVGGTCRPNPFYDGKPVRTPEDAPKRKRR